MLFRSTAGGLTLLASATNAASVFIGWTLIGLALRSILYDGAFAAVSVLAGDRARRAISTNSAAGSRPPTR